MKKLMIAAGAALMGLAASAAETMTVYVAPNGNDTNDGSAAKPVLNLSRAFEVMRAATNATAKRVLIRDGVYKIEAKAVGLTPKDKNVTIEAEHPGKVLYTGAEKVTGWKPYEADSRFLVADLPFEGKAEMLYMLSVAGENAELASYPDFGGENKMPYLASQEDAWSGNRTVMKYDSLALPKGQTFEGLDLTSAWVTVPQEWATTRSFILTNDWQHDTFVFKTPINMPLGQFNTGFQIVNCRVGMRKPGMWMFEAGKGRIVYWPKEGETAEKLNEIATVSRAQAFLTAYSAENLVIRGLTIEGLASPFNTWRVEPDPVAIRLSGYVHATNRYNMVVEDCEIRSCAGVGIKLAYANGCFVRRCHVHDMGSTGIMTEGSSGHNSITFNHIHHCSLFNTSGSCMYVASGSSHYDNNHIHHSPYAGCTMWSYQSTFNSNHIHHTMLSGRDGGGLYGAYMFTDLIGNWTHDMGNWPGLYNDEGGQRCTFALNNFEGGWWPFHMHDCYGIVVTNNILTCRDAMRFSFQGSCHCIFSNNLIRTGKMITKDPYMETCDVWMDNPIELWDDAKKAYVPTGKKVTLPKLVKPAKAPLVCVPSKGLAIQNWLWIGWFADPQGWHQVDRTKEGYYAYGVPGNVNFCTVYDSTNLYFHGQYHYNKLMGYKGSRHNGHEWGTDDGIRFCFQNGYTATLFFDKDCKAVFSDGATNSAFNVCMCPQRSVGDGWIYWAIAVPFEKTGLKIKTAADAIGKEIKFNVISYNGDHDETRYLMQPNGKDLLTARMKFAYKDKPDLTGGSVSTMLQSEDGAYWPGAMYPFGKVQLDLETSYRHTDVYEAAQGYQPRNIKLMGYALRDRAGMAAGHRAFLFQAYTGEDPVGKGRRSQHMEQYSQSAPAGRYHVNLQRWDLETYTFASENAVWVRYHYPRGGIFKLLVDGNYADGDASVSASEIKVEGQELVGHNRVKTGFFGKGYDVWTKMAFNHRPVKVDEIETPGKGKRCLVTFDLDPVDDDLVIKTTVSEQSAEDAAARFAAEPTGFDFYARQAQSVTAWQKVFEGQQASCDVGGDGKMVRVFKTAVYGAYTMPGNAAEKKFVVINKGTDKIKVTAKGVKDASSVLKSVLINGAAAPEKGLAADAFKDGSTLELVFE